MAKDKSLIVANLNAIISDERVSGTRRLLATMLKAYAKAKDPAEKALFRELLLSEYGFGRRGGELVKEEGNPRPADPGTEKKALQTMKDLLAELGGDNAAVQNRENGSGEIR
jgi:hypothetical protein